MRIWDKPKRAWMEGISLQNGRPTNMDSIVMAQREIAGEQALLAVVCDGVGSLEDGGFAAGQTTEGLVSWFQRCGSTDRIGLELRDQLLRINASILEQTAQDHRETATTCSALLIVGQRYHIAHAGDSRIYALEGMEQLTQDDVAEDRSLTTCIGFEPDPLVSCGQGQVAGRSFLLCSDGMYKRLTLEDVGQLVSTRSPRQLRRSLEQLAQTAIDRGEKDNISIIIVKTRNGGPKQ